MAGRVDDDKFIREHLTRAYVGKRGEDGVILIDLEEITEWDPMAMKELPTTSE